MRFVDVPVAEAAGAVLAHSADTVAGRLKKGRRLTDADVSALAAQGYDTVTVARLDPGDLGEDEAAKRIAQAAAGEATRCAEAATGRVNIHAIAAGVFRVSREVVDALNAIDPAITIATLADFATVAAGTMVATVKIIPFAVRGELVEKAVAVAGTKPVMSVRPFRPRRVHLVQTELSVIKPSVLDKTARVTQARLDPTGSRITGETRTAHRTDALAPAIEKAAAGADIVLVFGASAVVDEDDVIPASIRAAGGVVERFGMPVDPGNLLVLGRIGTVPVLGAPGCARSPKENGFDWVLDRLIADVDVSDADIARMGVGGLLMEIPTRPQPRSGKPGPGPVVRALVLAAGQSRRMGRNKLLADFDGVPLVRRTVQTVLSSKARSTVVVTGHQAETVRAALTGLDVALAHNPAYADGMSTSLKAGLAAMPQETDALLVALADMPGVSAADLDRMIAAASAAPDAIIRATHNGKRGNPVILPRQLFGQIAALSGDVGARHLVEGGAAEVVDVELGTAASVDVDTPEALAAAGGRFTD